MLTYTYTHMRALSLSQEWYKTVLDFCELNVDLTLFPNGDLSEIGDRGVTLSGGQKARLSLARAVYARADILLLVRQKECVNAYVCICSQSSVSLSFHMRVSASYILYT